jgi:hypothetical protein
MNLRSCTSVSANFGKYRLKSGMRNVKTNITHVMNNISQGCLHRNGKRVEKNCLHGHQPLAKQLKLKHSGKLSSHKEEITQDQANESSHGHRNDLESMICLRYQETR